MKIFVVMMVALLAMLGSVSSSALTREFDSTLQDMDTFAKMLQEQTQLQHDSEMAELHASLDDAHDAALLELSAAEEPEAEAEAEAEAEGGADEGASKNPSWTLPYPPLMYAHYNHGGFFHPFSNVNPLGAPWGGFAPVAHPAFGYAPSVAAAYHAPLTAALAGHALYHGAALGVNSLLPFHHHAAALRLNTGLYPHAALYHHANAKGGYNVHGLNPGSPWGYHPGLDKDLKSLGGGKPEGAAEAEGEAEAETEEEAAFIETHNPEDMNSEATTQSYGLYPAPMPSESTSFVRSQEFALGPHSSQLAEVGENEIDSDFPA